MTQLGVASDPTNRIYYLALLCLVFATAPESSFWLAEHSNIICRVRQELSKKQMDCFMRGIRCKGVVEDAGDVLEAVAGICHAYDIAAFYLRTRKSQLDPHFSEEACKIVAHKLSTLVRRVQEIACFLCQDSGVQNWASSLCDSIRSESFSPGLSLAGVYTDAESILSSAQASGNSRVPPWRIGRVEHAGCGR